MFVSMYVCLHGRIHVYTIYNVVCIIDCMGKTLLFFFFSGTQKRANVLDIVRRDTLVMSKDAIEKLTERLARLL